MAEGDNRVQMGDTSVTKELAGDTAKANPIAMTRTTEAQARADAYAAAGEKDVLPEHQARRDTYPLITATT